MKQSIILLFTFLFFVNPTKGQDTIEYGSHNGQYINVFDSNLYYEVYGDGIPLLLLHGGLGSISNFKNVIPELSNHFQVIAIDSPGHGRSEYVDSLSYLTMANYFVEMINKMDLDSLYIMGYSDGAISGLLAAYEDPEKIKRVVFGGGALGPDASKPGAIEILKNASPHNMPQNMVESYKHKSPNPDKWEQFVFESKEMWLQDNWIPKHKLKNIQSRTLILLGDRDEFIPIAHGVEIYHAITNSEFCVLPNTHHNIYNRPDLVNPVVINFLKKQ